MIVKIIVSIFSPEFKKPLLLSLIEVIRGSSAYETFHKWQFAYAIGNRTPFPKMLTCNLLYFEPPFMTICQNYRVQI